MLYTLHLSDSSSKNPEAVYIRFRKTTHNIINFANSDNIVKCLKLIEQCIFQNSYRGLIEKTLFYFM